jgi:SagB-type dehydrogenase family enzyme
VATKLAQVRNYHRISKHALSAYAPGPGFLDWDSQPQPFRQFSGVKRFPLPRAMKVGRLYGELFETPASSQPPTLETIATLLELAFGISAWKSAGPDRWAMRNNPSSGNLHPSEVYLILWRGVDPLPPGLYHYSVYDHALEQLALLDEAVALRTENVFSNSFGAVALSSVQWREEWKYGARALRYCQLDAGHAMAAAAVAAATLGWSLDQDEQICDRTLSELLGLARIDTEPEHPEWLCLLSADQHFLPPTPSEPAWQAVTQAMAWGDGTASRLSEESIQWPEIRRVLPALEKPVCERMLRPTYLPVETVTPPAIDAAELIRRRRSAQRMDPDVAMRRDDFERALAHTLPQNRLPFATLPDAAAIHLLLFVHQVEGLAPGLYLLSRNDSALIDLREQCADNTLQWQPVDGTTLPLYWLKPLDDQRPLTSRLCCHQGIAGRGAFSVGMLADFRELQRRGAWAYRDLFWQAGMIGQMLYLEAEASGLRGTGIGCYFDDEVLALLGLAAEGDWQSLYHFTVGAALDDPRMTTEPPYAHLGEGRA